MVDLLPSTKYTYTCHRTVVNRAAPGAIRMTLKLTPAVLKHAYEFLDSTEPFCKWNLPAGHEIKFVVTKSRKNCGRAIWWSCSDITIEISSYNIGHTINLLCTMAHEMVHVYQYCVKMDRGGEHNAAFKKLSAQVCKAHGFDPKLF
jgi:hypothetical protein